MININVVYNNNNNNHKIDQSLRINSSINKIQTQNQTQTTTTTTTQALSNSQGKLIYQEISNSNNFNHNSNCKFINNNNNNNYKTKLIDEYSNLDCNFRNTNNLNNTNSPHSSFYSSTNNNNNINQETIFSSSSSSSSSSSNLLRNNNSKNQNSVKRLSCEELENLKERFVDFIKLDPSSLTHTDTTSTNLCQTHTNTATTTTSSQVNNNMINSSISIKTSPMSTDCINEPSFPSPPLPPPPPPPLPPAHASSSISPSSSSSLSSLSQSINISKKPELSKMNKLLRLSVVSSESSSSSSAESSLSSVSSCSSSSSIKPEPPQRTVSIRNSSCNIYSSASLLNDSKQDDCLSIKSSSIYSSCRGSVINQPTTNLPVRSSRSVFSIYEEEDENSSAISSATSSSSSSSSSSTSFPPNYLSKLERLKEFDIQRIESMYRSIGSIVNVSSCTCDLLSTTSEQIANLLNDCWRLEISSVVPIWIFDTGFNPKREKQLRLMFVDRLTGFPLIKKPVLIDKNNQIKNPNNDKRLTFTLKNHQLVCLIKFYDYFSCHEFYKFYMDLMQNPRNSDLFEPVTDENSIKVSLKNTISSNSKNKSQSRSMVSLTRLPNEKLNSSLSQLIKPTTNKQQNRYSELITSPYNNQDKNDIDDEIDDCDKTIQRSKSKIKQSATDDSIMMRNKTNSNSNINKRHSQLVTTITKHCISNPCAFQHINSLKNDDQHVKLLIEAFNNNCSLSNQNQNKVNLLSPSSSNHDNNSIKQFRKY